MTARRAKDAVEKPAACGKISEVRSFYFYFYFYFYSDEGEGSSA